MLLRVILLVAITCWTRAVAAQDEIEDEAELDLGLDADDGGFERNTGAPYPAVALLLGLAGTDSRGPADFERNFTFGLLGRYMFPVHKHVSLGGQLAMRSWQSDVGVDNDAGRNMLLELVFVPAATYPATREIELHAILPLGPMLNFADDFEGDASVGTGFTIGILVGARFFLDPNFGLLTELGYVAHSFSHDIDIPVEAEVELDIDEASLNVGLVF